MQEPKKAVVLRLDPATMEAVDQIRQRLGVDRTAWLRTAVERSINYDQRVTLVKLAAALDTTREYRGSQNEPK